MLAIKRLTAAEEAVKKDNKASKETSNHNLKDGIAEIREMIQDLSAGLPVGTSSTSASPE